MTQALRCAKLVTELESRPRRDFYGEVTIKFVASRVVQIIKKEQVEEALDT